MSNHLSFPEDRLRAVLTTALLAPGNWPRFAQAGLIASHSPENKPSLTQDWQKRFNRLSLLDKYTVRQSPGQFLATIEDVVYRGSTSGSRTQSYLFFANSSWNQQRVASRQHYLSWWGIDDETPIINLASRLLPGRVRDLAIAGPIDKDCLTTLVACLEETPSVVRGYPSRLCEVASHLTQPLPDLKAVICTGEPLFEHQQTLLESVFQAPVINEYGCHEAAVSGMTCPEAGRLHLDETRCFYEVIDDSLVITDLWNEVMPLIRYQCGDRIQLHPTDCPCGRPGLTANLWGRVEDSINTKSGLVPPGQVKMPPLPGLLHYRIERQSSTQVAAWGHVKNRNHANLARQSLQTWTKQTFGTINVNITLESPGFLLDAKAKHPLASPFLRETGGGSKGDGRGIIQGDEREEKAIFDPTTHPDKTATETSPYPAHDWIETITQSLGKWLDRNRMPTGEAQPLAQLLKTLLTPRLIGLKLPRPIQHQITNIAHSPISRDSRLETLKGRILLLACSCLRTRQEAEDLYHQAITRLQQSSTPLEPATVLDQLIPLLYLTPAPILSVWHALPSISTYTLDSLNIYHLLSAFETALHHHRNQRSYAAKTLKPPLALLIGDLSHWAAELTTAHLLHWGEFLQGQTLTPQTPISQPSFSPKTHAWLQWRQHFIRPSTEKATEAAFNPLQSIAKTQADQARLYVEKGYHQILTQQTLNPSEWLEIIETYAGQLSSPSSPGKTDLTPWMPIVNALIGPLHEQGEHELAYRCLVAASLSSRQQSAFDRLTGQFNQKQSILKDLSLW